MTLRELKSQSLSLKKIPKEKKTKTFESFSNKQIETQREVLTLELSIFKTTFNTHLKNFNDISHLIIKKEEERDKINHKISSLLKKQQMILSSINEEFFSYVGPMTLRMRAEVISGVLFILNFSNGTENQLEIFLHSKDNLLNLLNLSSDNMKILFDINLNEFKNKRTTIQNIKDAYSRELIFPIDTIYDFGLNCFEIIETENEIKKLQCDIDKEIENKNKEFILLKNAENNILQKESLFKKINSEYSNYLNSNISNVNKINKETNDKEKKNDVNNINNNQIIYIIGKNKSSNSKNSTKKGERDKIIIESINNNKIKKEKTVKKISALILRNSNLSLKSTNTLLNFEKTEPKYIKENNKRKSNGLSKKFNNYKSQTISERIKSLNIVPNQKKINSKNKINFNIKNPVSYTQCIENKNIKKSNKLIQNDKNKKDLSVSKESIPFYEIDSVCDELNVGPVNIIGGKIKKEYRVTNYISSLSHLNTNNRIQKKEPNGVNAGFKIEKPINMGGCCVSCT